MSDTSPSRSKNPESAEESVNVSHIRQLQQQLTYLEKKVDMLVDELCKKKTPRDFREKKFARGASKGFREKRFRGGADEPSGNQAGRFYAPYAKPGQGKSFGGRKKKHPNRNRRNSGN